MKNELLEFSALIAVATQTNAIEMQQTTPIEGSKHASALQNASRLVLNALATLACSKHRTSLLYRQVRKVQDFCCRSLTAIYSVNVGHGIKIELVENSKGCLLSILQVLKTDYVSGFNADLLAPMYWNLNTVEELAKNENLMLAGLNKQKISSGLRELLLTAFKPQASAQFYSFQQLNYLLFCQQLVINFCKKLPNEQAEELLIAQLVYYNFNDNEFLSYIKQLIEADLLSLLHDKAQYHKLCEIEKELFSVIHQHEFALYHNRMSAQSQLLAYVTAGIVYFHRKTDFKNGIQPQSSTMVLQENYRIKINLSADGLAYLIRLLIETDTIEGNPKSKVILFFASHFQTPGIGDELLSVNSLGTKYKQVVQRTANQLRTLLKKMLKKIESEFAE